MIIYNGKVSNLLFGGHFVYMAAILDTLYLLRRAAKHQVHLLGHLEYKDMTFSDILYFSSLFFMIYQGDLEAILFTKCPFLGFQNAHFHSLILNYAFNHCSGYMRSLNIEINDEIDNKVRFFG